jgi:hypothetical protein
MQAMVRRLFSQLLRIQAASGIARFATAMDDASASDFGLVYGRGGHEADPVAGRLPRPIPQRP